MLFRLRICSITLRDTNLMETMESGTEIILGSKSPEMSQMTLVDFGW